jgi:hypothetical protein
MKEMVFEMVFMVNDLMILYALRLLNFHQGRKVPGIGRKLPSLVL